MPVTITDINDSTDSIIYQFKNLNEAQLFLGVDEAIITAASQNGSIIHSVNGARPGLYKVTFSAK